MGGSIVWIPVSSLIQSTVVFNNVEGAVNKHIQYNSENGRRDQCY